MKSKVFPYLVVPQEQEWPVRGVREDGQLILDRGFIASVERVNGLARGSLNTPSIVELLLDWYDERRRIGFPKDPLMELVAQEHQVA